MEDFTRALAARLAALSREPLSEDAKTVARRGIVDLVGVMIAGSVEPAARIAHQCFSGGSGARLIPSGEAASPDVAALVNGVAGHVLDYDDVALDGHPSAVLVPALLAEGEACNATAEEVLRSYALGYEAWGALWRASPNRLHPRGWHPSGVFGAIGAAVACAALHRADEAEIANAIGIAAAESGGLGANFGAMAKSYQVGRAARAGVVAARLAAAGFTGAADVLEHRSGFFAAFCGGLREGALEGGWLLPHEGLNVKMYPMCYATHRIIDATLELAPRVQSPDAVERVTARMGHMQLGMLRNHAPQTGLEAKFSAEFAVAAALTAGQVGVAELRDDFVRRADVQALMRKVQTEPITETLPDQPFAPYDQLVIGLRDGSFLESARVPDATGCHARPPSRAQLARKFEDCAAPVIGEERTRRLFDALDRMDGPERISDVLVV
jgi:2-methylcitrate dehydratase PrpD